MAVWPSELAASPVASERRPRSSSASTSTCQSRSRGKAARRLRINPNAAYESAVSGFVATTLAGAGAERFLAAFVPFARRVARVGAINALAQLVLKLVSPGVPDFYQGSELWDLTWSMPRP